MANTSGNDDTARFFFIPAITLLLVFLPCTAAASTPPLLPSLAFSPQIALPGPGQDLVLSVLWERNGIPYRFPPGEVTVTLYALPEGRPAGHVLLQKSEESPGSCTESCRYTGILRVRDLPAGEFMAIALDPLSGAFAREPVTLAGPAPGQGTLPATSATPGCFPAFPLQPFVFA